MVSKYPEGLDIFTKKTNAEYDGDPNGDFVMAEDVNELQDGIQSIQEALGSNPQGDHANVKTRLDSYDNYSMLQVPSVFFYLGEYNKLNGVGDEEKLAHMQRFNHVIIPIDMPTNFIRYVRSSVQHVYGYISVSMTESALSLGDIIEKIRTFKEQGCTGIYLDNMGYDQDVNRRRQTDVIQAVHNQGMSVMFYAVRPEDVMEANYHESMNEDSLPSGVRKGDILHIKSFAVNTLGEFLLPAFKDQMAKLLQYRETYGIQLMSTALIDSTQSHQLATSYFQYAHNMAILYSLDIFGTTIENDGRAINKHTWYSYPLLMGAWKSKKPTVQQIGNLLKRGLPAGTLTVDTDHYVWTYEGSKIPMAHVDTSPNTIPGSAIQDASIEDKKIKDYNGGRLIRAINADETEKLSIKKFGTLSYDDIEGSVSVDALTANVINAINAYIGEAKIDKAFIGDLTAEHITSGTIDADFIKASVIEAINIAAGHGEFGSAKIHGAVIDELNATSIKTGDIDADRIKTNIIEAINFESQSANIKNLNADNITSGNIKAERLQSDVINAINLYTESAVINKATIKEASIGDLSAEKIKTGTLKAELIEASVIEAINLYAEHMTVDSAKMNTAVIGELVADHIKASVIEAIHLAAGIASIDVGKINGAVINTGTIGDAQIADASITDAKIVSLTANKIQAGQIDTGLVTVQGPDGLLKIKSNRLQVFDRSAIPIERVSIGDVNGDGSQYGFRVRGADGKTVLYDEKGVYNEGITDGAITNPKIGDGEIDNRVIAADAIMANNIVAGAITAEKIGAKQINANHIQVGTITAGSAIIAEGAISNAQIGNLDATKITSGIIDAKHIRVGSTTNFDDGYNPNVINKGIRDDLNLKSPLPTAVTLGDFGIKAENQRGYAKMSGDGLVISNGFLEIIGGLTEDQISDSAKDKWNDASDFMDNMINDSIISVYEKRTLSGELKTIELDSANLLKEADFYWPDDDPPEQYVFKAALEDLKTFLTITPDLNNSLPPLALENLSKDSKVDGAKYKTLFENYKKSYYDLEDAINIRILEIQAEYDKELDVISKNNLYRLDIISSEGNIFKNGQVDTVLDARLFKNGKDITDEIPASKFIWKRVSHDKAGDLAWNEAHKTGFKTITITNKDVFVKATFNCSVDE